MATKCVSTRWTMMVTRMTTAVTRWPSQGHIPPALRSSVSVLTFPSLEDEGDGLVGEPPHRRGGDQHADPEDGLVTLDADAEVHQQDAHAVERVVQHGGH